MGEELCKHRPFLVLLGTTRVNRYLFQVAYPLLRVESQEVEVERLGGFPPGLLGPTSIESLDLQIDGDLGSLETPKAAGLTKLAPQLAIGAFQQRGGADEFACHPFQG